MGYLLVPHLIRQNPAMFDEIGSQASAFFANHKVPWCLILREDICTEDLLADSARHGFAFSETTVTMVLTLLHGAHLESSNPNILIMDDKLDQWMLPMVEAFESTFYNTKHYKNTHAQALARKKNLRHFSLFSGNAPISLLTLSWNQDCARIDDVSTLKAYQRQGNATALLKHVLQVASPLGLRYCFLEASDSGA